MDNYARKIEILKECKDLFADINVNNVKQKIRQERGNMFNDGIDVDKAQLRIMYCKYLADIKAVSSVTTETYFNHNSNSTLANVETVCIEHEHTAFEEYLSNIQNETHITEEKYIYD